VLLFLGSASIYGWELYLGIELWLKPTNASALGGLLGVLLGAYAIGLGRAWQILGAPRTGLISDLLYLIERRRARRQPPKT
jgi:hypothetical protein